MSNTRTIQAYDLVNFVLELEQAVKDGFSTRIEEIPCYPVQYGTHFSIMLVKDDTPTLKENKKEEQTVTSVVDASQAQDEVQKLEEAQSAETPKRGRKAGK